MPKQPKLTDMQLVLLATASQRADGNFFPTAESLKNGESRIPKAIESLVKRGFAAEMGVGAKVPSWREDGDRRIGVAITAEGRAAIGDGDAEEGRGGPEPSTTASPPSPPARKTGEIRPGSKQALLVEMLERKDGASIQEIVDVTGWLAHSSRAALTGLKKRGFEITSKKVEGHSRYHAKRPA